VLDVYAYGQFAGNPEGFDAPEAWQPVGEEGVTRLAISPLATVVLAE
jgi:hypothetical protein